ncbi:MAG: biotin transporter BioY [Paracoccaceae bacterium]
MTLSQALVPSQSMLTKALMVIGGSLLIGLSAQAEVPMYPVPMTLQTLAISLIGLTYGSRMAALTLLAYLAEGAAGLPVFAGGSFGAAKLIGPTAGFLWGFVAMAWMTGWLVERGLDKGVIKLFIAALIPSMLLFVPGGAWPMIAGSFGVAGEWTGSTLDVIWSGWVAPFLVGGVVKSAIAALIVAGGWAALKSRNA